MDLLVAKGDTCVVNARKRGRLGRQRAAGILLIYTRREEGTRATAWGWPSGGGEGGSECVNRFDLCYVVYRCDSNCVMRCIVGHMPLPFMLPRTQTSEYIYIHVLISPPATSVTIRDGRWQLPCVLAQRVSQGRGKGWQGSGASRIWATQWSGRIPHSCLFTFQW